MSFRLVFNCAGAALAVWASVAPAQEGGTERSAGRDRLAAEHRLQDYVRLWEQDENVAPRAMAAHYADHVIYYGKPMSREQVLADKLRFIRAFPERRYDIEPGSLGTRCRGDLCTARALLVWRRTSVSGTAREGASRLTLVFSSKAGGRIVRESARAVRRPGG